MKIGLRICQAIPFAGLLLVAACSGAPDGSSASSPSPEKGASATGESAPDVIATFPASAITKEKTGIARWEIREKGASVLGLDGAGATAWRLTLSREPSDPDHVDLAAVSPEAGKVTLARDGSLAGVASARLHQVASAFYADADANDPSKAAPKPAVHVASVRASAGGAYLAYAGDINLGWNLWGYSFNVPEGGFCPFGTRGYGNAYMNYGSGSCYWSGWADPQTPNDCKIMVYVSEYGAQTGNCHWEVFGID